MLGTALALKPDSAGPILSPQICVGHERDSIICQTFRSMSIDTERRLAELRDMNEGDNLDT